MRVFSYCVQSAVKAVRAATGVEPVSSPPITADRFVPEWLDQHHVVYFRLHGKPGKVGWFNDEGEIALGRMNVDTADMCGAIVVVANCFAADSDPMVDELYKAGAAVVIGGRGLNFAARRRVVGVDLLVKWFLRGLHVFKGDVERALRFAKLRLRLTAWRKADRDAMKFEIIGRF